MNKKAKIAERLILIIFVVALMTTSFGTLFAQVQRQGVAENEITSGIIKVNLLNKNKAGEDMPELITKIVPGDTLDNIVKVENDCDYAEYIRISLFKKIVDSDENHTELDSSKVNFLINEKDWTYKDGYYYYNYKLNPKEISSALYDGIYLDTTMGNIYKTATLDVEIVVEAVQSVNNGDNALMAEGWEVVAK